VTPTPAAITVPNLDKVAPAPLSRHGYGTTWDAGAGNTQFPGLTRTLIPNHDGRLIRAASSAILNEPTLTTTIEERTWWVWDKSR
jgi:hypothetical protein